LSKNAAVNEVRASLQMSLLKVFFELTIDKIDDEFYRDFSKKEFSQLLTKESR